MFSLFKWAFTVSIVLFTQIVSAAGVGINATRIIYPENEKSVSIGLRNTSPDTVYLLTAKVVPGTEGGEKGFFYPSPAIFRMNPDSQHKVRISGNTSLLPKDRESVFYFQATAIPSSRPAGDNAINGHGTAGMNVSLTTTIKLFYRPKGLAMAPAEGWRDLKVMPSSKGVTLKNTSPYYISFAEITVNGKPVSLKEGQQEMIAPFSELTYKSKERSGKVSWKVINDLGGIESYQASLVP